MAMRDDRPATRAPGRFDPELTYQAARMYYREDVTQAEIAERLNVSRPTVSRLIAQARRRGLVRIEVVRPAESADAALADELREALGLDTARVGPTVGGSHPAQGLGSELGTALTDLAPRPGTVVLVSSGRTMYEVSRSGLPTLPGIEVVPAVGGVAEPEAWHQTNEICRSFAEQTLGRPNFLFAQAMPSAAMYASLRQDEEFVRVTGLWAKAEVAVVGVGGPLTSRHSISRAIPADSGDLARAVGDICLNFFDYDGAPIEFPGSDRLVRISADQLRTVPHTVAIAVGREKVASLVAAAQAQLYNELITDAATAQALLWAVTR